LSPYSSAEFFLFFILAAHVAFSSAASVLYARVLFLSFLPRYSAERGGIPSKCRFCARERQN
jgi:hypothetical protein